MKLTMASAQHAADFYSVKLEKLCQEYDIASYNSYSLLVLMCEPVFPSLLSVYFSVTEVV